ncbi:MAG: hypothetical protein EX285_08825 [Thaumarchaeota archaeon]|nr:hypothetical protein [Nitrososphaerota archaeon]
MGINNTIDKHWRSWAALLYMFICFVDFFFAPLIWNLKMEDYCIEMMQKGLECDTSRWAPLTLGAGAMFHLSFGAILGATAWKKHHELEIHHNNSNSNTT